MWKLRSKFASIILTLRSKVKVQCRACWYETHCLMVIHIHAKDHKSMWNYKKRLYPWHENVPKDKKKTFDLDVEGHLKVVIIHHTLEDGCTRHAKDHKSISKDKKCNNRNKVVWKHEEKPPQEVTICLSSSKRRHNLFMLDM